MQKEVVSDAPAMAPAPAAMDTGMIMDTTLPRTGAFSDSAYQEAFDRIRASRARQKSTPPR
jgi:hypothetical protein